MDSVDIMSHNKAIADINRMLVNMDKPKVSQQQKYWQDRADSAAMLSKKPMVVVKRGNDHYQVWHKRIADGSNYEIVYVAGDE